MMNESNDQRLRRLNQTRGGLRARASRSINKLNELLNNDLNEENKNELAALSDVLTKLRASLESANTEIQGIISEEEIVTDMEKCDEYDDKLALHIQKVKSKVAEANRDLITPETITNRTSMNVGSSENGRLKLPKLDLPKFDGSYSQWAYFQTYSTEQYILAQLSLIHRSFSTLKAYSQVRLPDFLLQSPWLMLIMKSQENCWRKDMITEEPSSGNISQKLSMLPLWQNRIQKPFAISGKELMNKEELYQHWVLNQMRWTYILFIMLPTN